jgi:hypothetical protein
MKMKKAQKIAVWCAALDAVKNERFGARLLVANDVAKALGWFCNFDEKYFVLFRGKKDSGGMFSGLILKVAYA